MTKTLILTPFSYIEDQINYYTKVCIGDALARGEHPLAAQLLFYNGILNCKSLSESAMGVDTILAWQSSADVIAAYCDYGLPDEMLANIHGAANQGRKVDFRYALPSSKRLEEKELAALANELIAKKKHLKIFKGVK